MSERNYAYVIFGVLLSALSIATTVGWVLRARMRNPNSKATIQNLNTRIASWWIMIAVAGGCCMLGRRVLVLLFAALSFGALRESLTVMAVRASDRRGLLSCFLLVLPVQYALVWMQWYGLFTIFIPVYAFMVLPLVSAVAADTHDFLARTAEIQWGIMVAVYCLSYVPALQTLNLRGFHGDAVLLVGFLLIVTQSSDVLQYVFGKLFGRHAIAPQLSPSKTVEGTVGGILSATMIGALMWRVTPFTPMQAMILAFIVALAGFSGGLVMSAIKRDRKVKDWGHVLSGHGGILDRLDSVCFSAPLFFHLTRYFFA